MSPQLAAYFAAHKTAILGAAAAGVAGLALLQRKKGAGATKTAGAAAAQPAGTIPAAALAPAAGGYDSSAYDVYSALQSELSPILQAQMANSVTTAPTPVASSLFAPNGTGQYVAYKGTGAGDNSINEVESDGSLYHLGMPEWLSIINANGGKEPTLATFSGKAPTDFSYAANLQSKIAAGTGKA